MGASVCRESGRSSSVQKNGFNLNAKTTCPYKLVVARKTGATISR